MVLANTEDELMRVVQLAIKTPRDTRVQFQDNCSTIQIHKSLTDVFSNLTDDRILLIYSDQFDRIWAIFRQWIYSTIIKNTNSKTVFIVSTIDDDQKNFCQLSEIDKTDSSYIILGGYNTYEYLSLKTLNFACVHLYAPFDSRLLRIVINSPNIFATYWAQFDSQWECTAVISSDIIISPSIVRQNINEMNSENLHSHYAFIKCILLQASYQNKLSYVLPALLSRKISHMNLTDLHRQFKDAFIDILRKILVTSNGWLSNSEIHDLAINYQEEDLFDTSIHYKKVMNLAEANIKMERHLQKVGDIDVAVDEKPLSEFGDGCYHGIRTIFPIDVENSFPEIYDYIVLDANFCAHQSRDVLLREELISKFFDVCVR